MMLDSKIYLNLTEAEREAYDAKYLDHKFERITLDEFKEYCAVVEVAYNARRAAALDEYQAKYLDWKFNVISTEAFQAYEKANGWR